MDQQHFSIKKRIKSFIYAFRGLKILFRTQHNTWVHLSATLTVVILGFIFSISVLEWLFVIVSIGIVLTAEALNTSMEFLVDFISPEHDKKAAMVKDLAAAAVFIAALVSVIVGLIIFLPKFINYF